MKITKILLPILCFASLATLSGCDIIEDGNINDYVGEYISNTGTETTKHYYWGQTTIVSETQIFPSGIKLTISSNKKAILTYGDGSTKTGRIRVFKEYVKFSNLPMNSSYKFKQNSDKGLIYNYTQEKYGLEYNFITRHMSFSYLSE